MNCENDTNSPPLLASKPNPDSFGKNCRSGRALKPKTRRREVSRCYRTALAIPVDFLAAASRSNSSAPTTDLPDRKHLDVSWDASDVICTIFAGRRSELRALARPRRYPTTSQLKQLQGDALQRSEGKPLVTHIKVL